MSTVSTDRSSRRTALVVFCAVVFVGGLLFGGARVTASAAARSLTTAWTQVQALQEGEATSAETVQRLQTAQAQVAGARESMSGFIVEAVAALPLLGRSLDAERDVIHAAETSLAAAVLAAERLPDVRAAAGGVDIVALADMRAQLDARVRRAESAYSDLMETSTILVPGVVARGVEQARTSLGPAVARLREAQQVLSLAERLLGGAGARSVLVALENNAELRGSGGYVATFATGSFDGGRLALQPLQDVVAVADPPAQARQVPAPVEFRQDYGALSGDTTIWRSWNMSPHVPDSALVGARVAGVLLGDEPDVVILLDVPAMSALARLGGGGVTLPDGTVVSPEALTDALLVDAYAEAGAAVADQEQRRAELQAAATAAVTRLLGGEVEPVETIRTLGTLVDQRHLKIWSARAEEQQLLQALGIAGSVGARQGTDLSHVSVNNVGGNKIDIYIDRDVDVDVVIGPERAEVVQRVRFTNTAPEGLVPYVAGVDNPGAALSRVEFSVPVDAEILTATEGGRPWTGTSRLGEDRRRLATRIELPRGASTDLEVRYTVPVEQGNYRLQLVPQPLASDATLSLSVRPAEGWELSRVQGAELTAGTVEETSPFAVTRRLEVELAPPGVWTRLVDAVPW